MLSFIKAKWYSYKFDNETRQFGLQFFLLFYDLNQVLRESQQEKKSLTFNAKTESLRKKIQGFIDLKKGFLDYLFYGVRHSCDLDNAIRFLVAYASVTQGKSFSYLNHQSTDVLLNSDIDINYLMISKDAQRIFMGALSSSNLFQLTEYPKILDLEKELTQSLNRVIKDNN